MASTGAPICPSCKNKVFYNEQLIFAGKSWHRQCLRCMSCKTLLSVDKACEHDALPYCKTHYNEQFGVRGYSDSGVTTSRPAATTASSTGALNAMVQATGTGSNPKQKELFKTGCPRCGKRVYAAERTPALGKDWHKLCFRCFECNVLLHAGGYQEHEGPEGKLPFCKKCYDKLYGSEGYGRSGSRNVFANTPKAPVSVPTTTTETTNPPPTTEEKPKEEEKPAEITITEEKPAETSSAPVEPTTTTTEAPSS